LRDIRNRHVRNDSGATAVEYALMLVFIAAVIIAGATALGLGTSSGLATAVPGF
jgi:Flp pilus assembly pilin Flp